MVGREYKWYAIYVTRHHEKKVSDWISSNRIETLLPVRTSIKTWSDRIKKIEEPMFPSYLFVKVSCSEYFSILNHPSVVKYVSFGGEPEAIPESQVRFIRYITKNYLETEVVKSDFKPGEKVFVSRGPLKGTHGEVLFCAGEKRFILKIDSIGYSLSINIRGDSLLSVFQCEKTTLHC